MSVIRLIIKSILHYARLNVAVVLGIALSTAILVGALIVGDSVKYSLQQITIERLGKTEQVITAGERIFTTQLAENIRKTNIPTAALLRANGIAIVDGGQTRVNQIQVWGIDYHFGTFTKVPELYNLQDNQVLLNEKMAKILAIQPGDEFLIRVNKLSAFPANTPFISAEEPAVSFRVRLKGVVNALQNGNFNLQNSQSSPRNIFINSDFLNKQLGLKEKANVLLLSGQQTALETLIKPNWGLEDINLKVREDQTLGYSEIISERVFIDTETEKACMEGISSALPVFSYFVNRFELNGRKTPYSFVSTLTEGLSGNEMIINRWLADDLKAKPGDFVKVSYFEVGSLRQLIEKDTVFVVKQVVSMDGKWADQKLMPEIPGMSDAGHCRDWEAGIPIDLSSIRPMDEDYWNKYKGTPKAFISLETAQNLWQNRFGKITAIRFQPTEKEKLSNQLLVLLSPETLGFQLQEVKAEGIKAASSGTDFGQLFIGLSFFVLVAAVLLTVLMFKLFLDFRKNEIGTLKALGFSGKRIRRLFMTESLVLVVLGICMGIPLSLLFNQLVLDAVNSIWVDIVRTSIVYIYIRPVSIIIGALIILVLSAIIIWTTIGSFIKREAVSLQKNVQVKNKRVAAWPGLLLLTVSVVILLVGGVGFQEVNPMLFYLSGFGLLPAFILLVNYFFFRMGVKQRENLVLKSLIAKRIGGNRQRNTMIVSFLAIGIFMVVSTGVNRKDLTKNADQNPSGTGGYQLYVETTNPVLEDITNPEVTKNMGFAVDEMPEFVQFRVKQGDDASCLNLNLISRPRIMGFNPESFDRRKSFTFLTKTEELDEASPWLSLKQKTSDGLIPAIADQTVIKWGLGKNVGDTLVYVNEKGEMLHLKLIGGLANSVFQGSVLIDDTFFVQNFPSVSGCHVFMIDADSSLEQLETNVRANFKSYGADITPTTQRLLEFYKIENTYLNIFLLLGAFGLLIGTVGLGILLYRMTNERASEFALMRSIGFRKRKIIQLLLFENSIVIIVAVFTGIIPAMISVIPNLVSESYQNLIWWFLAIGFIVLFNGLFWAYISVHAVFRKNLINKLRNE